MRGGKRKTSGSDDFQSPKIQKIQTKKESSSSTQDNSEAMNCPICYDVWTSSGSHKIVSLKCGHLFGDSCIKKWIKSNKRCPNCNATSALRDIRPIYVPNIVCMDIPNDQLEKLKKELDIERRKRVNYENELKHKDDELRVLSNKYNRLLESKNTIPTITPQIPENREINDSITLLTTIQTRSSRVIELRFGVLFIDCQSENNPKYCIKKISTLDYKSTKLIPLHDGTIRDIKASPHLNDERLITVSTDKTLKVLHTRTDNVIVTYKTEVPIWSCAWNKSDNNLIYCGTVKGEVLIFDLRQTRKHLQQFSDVEKQPIHSLDHIMLGTEYQRLLCASTAKISLRHLSNFEGENILPYALSGSCTSLYCDESTNSIVASFRSTNNTSHILFGLSLNDKSINANIENTINTAPSTTLSRSLLFPYANKQCLAVTEANGMSIWDTSTGNNLCSQPLGKPPMDYAFYTSNTASLLGVLSPEEFNVYKLNF